MRATSNWDDLIRPRMALPRRAMRPKRSWEPEAPPRSRRARNPLARLESLGQVVVAAMAVWTIAICL